jgi:hypothetical protein
MNAKKIAMIAATLVTGAILNYCYALLAQLYAIPVRIECVIIAYCLLVMLLSLRIGDVIGIGILAGILTILSTPSHSLIFSGGQLAIAGDPGMALFNLVSEPAGILACFLAYACLKQKISTGAEFVTAFLATGISGMVYLLLVNLFDPGLIASTSSFTGDFILQVGQVAVVNGVLVQVLFMVSGSHLRAGPGEQTM